MTKKLLFVAASLFCLVGTLRAQKQVTKTTTTTTTTTTSTHTAVSVDAEKRYAFVGGLINFWHDPSASLTSFSLEPQVGYMFNSRWGIGTSVGYHFEQADEVALHAFLLSPFVRYYYFDKSPYSFYLDGGAAWAMYSLVGHIVHGFEVGIRPGASLDLADGLCLCLDMGFVGYRKNFLGHEQGTGENGFGVRFSPHELSIGLEWEL